MSKRAILAHVLILAGLGTWGCKPNTPSPTPDSPPQTPSPITPTADSSAQATGNDQDPAELARRTAQYARKIAPLLAQNGNQSATTVPSIVQWTEPNSHEGSHPNDAASVAAAEKKTAANPPRPSSPGPTAVLAADRTAQDSDVPLILPESADHVSANTPSPITIPTDDYEKKLAQQVRDYPRDLGTQLDYELLRFVRDEQTPDLTAISQLPAEDREILAAILDGISNFRNVARSDSNPMLSGKIRPLLNMSDRLRSQGELTIPTLALCTDVKSFGVYDPMPAPKFAAGKPNNLVIVYCEVADFTSVMDDQKMWQTRLRQEMVLYTETGMAIWPEKSNSEEFVDLARNRRHDFFVARKVNLPQALTLGRYLLKVTLTDEQSNRVAEATTPLDIVAE